MTKMWLPTASEIKEAVSILQEKAKKWETLEKSVNEEEMPIVKDFRNRKEGLLNLCKVLNHLFCETGVGFPYCFRQILSLKFDNARLREELEEAKSDWGEVAVYK